MIITLFSDERFVDYIKVVNTRRQILKNAAKQLFIGKYGNYKLKLSNDDDHFFHNWFSKLMQNF